MMFLSFVGILLVLFLAAAVAIGKLVNKLRIVAPISLLIVIVISWLTWSGLAESEPWEEARQNGDRTLEVAYIGGSCEDQRSVDVDEDDRFVTITIVTRTFADACDDKGNARTVQVRLDEPLGSRRLIDGSCEPKPAPGGCTRGAAARKAHPVANG